MTTKITGFKGKTGIKQAMALSKRASTQPSVFRLDDGSVVGLGDVILTRDGKGDQMMYGARGTTTWLSDYRSKSRNG
jgi:hypothetical protein